VPAVARSTASSPPANSGSAGPEPVAFSPDDRFASADSVPVADSVAPVVGPAEADEVAVGEAAALCFARVFVAAALFVRARAAAALLGMLLGDVAADPRVGLPVAVEPSRVPPPVPPLVGPLVAVRPGDGLTVGLGLLPPPEPAGETGAGPGAVRASLPWKRHPMKPPAGTLRDPMPTLE
jgi:hypothetical protein